ncbi:uncharacterized protein LOC117122148 [Anneissia japonica]|uniref:uncharacterized protein LOC117122148 n=1 Tax=Anneissia japonica TaxID=1529436 RepID=UPI0014257347|nr:uncharacterized protein LOC117122148 [Anneissia japonica]
MTLEAANLITQGTPLNIQTQDTPTSSPLPPKYEDLPPKYDPVSELLVAMTAPFGERGRQIFPSEVKLLDFCDHKKQPLEHQEHLVGAIAYQNPVTIQMNQAAAYVHMPERHDLLEGCFEDDNKSRLRKNKRKAREPAIQDLPTDVTDSQKHNPLYVESDDENGS